MMDIVKRLRQPVEYTEWIENYTKPKYVTIKVYGGILEEAAAEIERLREALKPFVCKCEPDHDLNNPACGGSKFCDRYKARSALQQKESESP